MTPASILVLHPRYDEDSQRMWQEALSAGWMVQRLSGYYCPAEVLAITASCERLTLYGGSMWGKHVAAQLGMELLSPPVDWITALPESLVKRWSEVAVLGDVRSGTYGWPVFVKTLHNKQMEPKVCQSADDLPDLDGELQVIVQGPVSWRVEYRCFVDRSGVRAMAQYSRCGELDVSSVVDQAEVLKFMDGLISGGHAPRANATTDVVMPCVIDVGLIDGLGMAVVEANPAWCSGLYACDVSQALEVVAGACSR